MKTSLAVLLGLLVWVRSHFQKLLNYGKLAKLYRQKERCEALIFIESYKLATLFQE